MRHEISQKLDSVVMLGSIEKTRMHEGSQDQGLDALETLVVRVQKSERRSDLVQGTYVHVLSLCRHGFYQQIRQGLRHDRFVLRKLFHDVELTQGRDSRLKRRLTRQREYGRM